jgi:hypothetical protein
MPPGPVFPVWLAVASQLFGWYKRYYQPPLCLSCAGCPAVPACPSYRGIPGASISVCSQVFQELTHLPDALRSTGSCSTQPDTDRTAWVSNTHVLACSALLPHTPRVLWWLVSRRTRRRVREAEPAPSPSSSDSGAAPAAVVAEDCEVIENRFPLLLGTSNGCRAVSVGYPRGPSAGAPSERCQWFLLASQHTSQAYLRTAVNGALS